MRPLLSEQKRNCGQGLVMLSRFDQSRRLGVTRTQPLQGETRYFPRVLQIKFVFDMRPVGFDSLGAEME